MSRAPVDQIEDAIIDVEGTAAMFTAIVNHVDVDADEREQCILVVERHLANDVEALRETFRKLHGKLRGKKPLAQPVSGSGPTLTVVRGDDK